MTSALTQDVMEECPVEEIPSLVRNYQQLPSRKPAPVHMLSFLSSFGISWMLLQVVAGALEYAIRIGLCRAGDSVVAVVASMINPDELIMKTFQVM